MNNFKPLLISLTLLAGTSYSFAASHAGAPMTMPAEVKKEMPAAAGAMAMGDMADGESRKVDMDNKKITIKHGEIKNLDMPGMTMVFQVKDPAILSAVKTGDKVRFKAEKSGGAIVVTEIQPVK